MNYSIKKSQKTEIIKLISLYFDQQYDEISAVYIFGSFINSDSFKDIDIGIIVNTSIPKPLIYEMKLETMLEKILEYKVDIRILNSAPISFCQAVIRNGQVILDKDPVQRSEFEGRTLKKYFDFARFRRLYLTEVLNAPI